MDKPGERPFELKPIPLLFGVLFVVAAVWAFYHYRHTIEHLSLFVQSLGAEGIAFSVVLMAILCILPVPSEFLIVINMEVYGVGWGLFYSWVGAVIGAVVAMFLTRWLGKPIVKRFLSEERQEQVDRWVKKRGTLGLFALRFIPFVPYHALNYVAGVLNVRLWPFVWTTAIGIIPFEIFMGGMFLGISGGVWPSITIGGITLLVALFVSYMFRKRWMLAFTSETAPDKQSVSRRGPGSP